MNYLLAAALELHAAGYCPVRASINGSKAPLGKWKTYQDPTNRPTVEELSDWFGNGHPGVGIITGQASGNAELLEFEGRAVVEGVFTEWSQHMVNSGLGGLLLRLLTGYLDATPGGGWHVHYRVTGQPVPGNTKLAERPSTSAEIAADPETRKQTFIETRGEGGFVITAPSNGATHPSGKPWQRKAGGPKTTPVLSAEEHDALMTTCRALDRMPRPEPIPRQSLPADSSFQDPRRDRPGDEFNAQHTWPEILTPRGWTVLYTSGGNTHWRRPGKSIGTSATTRQTETGDYLYVFSTSTPFDAERAYDKFGAYTVLEHGGDFTAAARALRPAPVATSVDVPGPTEAETNAIAELLPALDWHALWADDTTEEWIIEPLVPVGRLVAIYSTPKLGKSLLALEVAAGIATGRKVLGVTLDRPRIVLYVDFENDPKADVRTRLQAMGYEPGDLDKLRYLSFPSLAALDGHQGAHELMAAIAFYGAEVVVVDTISRAVAGEENSNDTWLNFYRHTGLQLKKAGISLVRLDHSGKDEAKGQRGGSAKLADVDVVWRLSKVTEAMFRLDCEAARMPITERHLVLHREGSPLRHRVDAQGLRGAWFEKQRLIIETLDKAKLPLDVGRPTAREALRDAEIKASDDVLNEALKVRKGLISPVRNGSAQHQDQEPVRDDSAQPPHRGEED